MMRSDLLRTHAVKAVALVFISVALLLNLLEIGPAASAPEAGQRFRFVALPLAEFSALAPRSIRQVHPSLQQIASWISSVGAAVAVADLDGDGLANDLCHTDPRWDKVLVSPAPSTGERFRLFSLDPPPGLYDAATMAPMGCAMADLNADGLVDFLVYYWGRTPLVFLNRGGAGPSGPEQFLVVDPIPTGERWFTNALTLADVDGDGRVDVVVGNYFQDGARVLDAHAAGRQSMQDSMSNSFNGGKNRILRQVASAPVPAPSVSFEDASPFVAEVARGWTLAVGAADLNDDLLPELYFANDFGPDRLLRNDSKPGRLNFKVVEGRTGFNVPGSKVLGRDSFKGMGIDFADLNRDGRLDIMVSNITSDFGLHESNFLFVSAGKRGKLSDYVDKSRQLGVAQSGWAWDARFGDFDNDGDPEIVQATGFVRGSTNRWPELHELATGNDALLADPRAWPRFVPGTDISGHQPNRFFVRDGASRYDDLGSAVGLDSDAVARGLATADIDGDGDLDLILANQWAPSVLYRNECLTCGRSLVLNLLNQVPGATKGVAAIGATATVTLPGGSRLFSQVDGGSGHSGKRSTEVHLGLGNVDPQALLAVELAWRGPDGIVHKQTTHLTPGRHQVLLSTTGEVGST